VFSGIEPIAAFRKNEEPTSTSLETLRLRMPKNRAVATVESQGPLRVVMVCPEIVPFAKTGGLADMSGSLALALEQLGHDVSLIMPAYRQALRSGIPLQETGIRVSTSVDGRMDQAQVLTAQIGRATRVYLIRADRYFDRAHLYGAPEGDYHDNAERF